MNGFKVLSGGHYNEYQESKLFLYISADVHLLSLKEKTVESLWTTSEEFSAAAFVESIIAPPA
jgi:hypothetical protein